MNRTMCQYSQKNVHRHVFVFMPSYYVNNYLFVMDGFHHFQRAQFPLPQQLRLCRKPFEIFYADLGNQTDPGQIYQIYCRIFSWSHQRSLAGQQNFRLNSPGTVFQFVQTTYFPDKQWKFWSKKIRLPSKFLTWIWWSDLR